MAIINDRIKQRRLELGYTLLEMAEFLGVKEATAQRYESGAIKTIGHDTITKLSVFLKCSPSFLMGWEEKAVPVPATSVFPLSELEKEIVFHFRKLNNGERSMFLRSLGIEEEKGDAAKMA